MTPTSVDHLFALFLVLVLPLLGGWQFRRLEARLAAGEEDSRRRHYRSVIVEEILLAATVLALWWTSGRPWTTLAPATPGSWQPWAVWVGWGLAAIACALLVAQAAAIGRSREGLAAARRQLEGMAAFLPREERELREFQALSLAAGIGEEIVFRGFAMAWLSGLAAAALGLGGGFALALAAVGSSVMFGLAHSYQGAAGMVRTGLVGLVLAGLAVATGGLLAPMLVHAVVDLTSGLVAYRALGPGADGDEAAAATRSTEPASSG